MSNLSQKEPAIHEDGIGYKKGDRVEVKLEPRAGLTEQSERDKVGQGADRQTITSDIDARADDRDVV
jgi:hypothetical protein